MMTRHAQHGSPRGFTLIELIAVMVVVGILAVTVAMSIGDLDYSLETETDLLRSRIRYTQARAMGRNMSHGISCTANTYFLYQGTDTSVRVPFPGEGDDFVSLPAEVTVPDFVISFDQWGVPYGSVDQANALAANQAVTLSETRKGATLTETLSIIPVTGFVP